MSGQPQPQQVPGTGSGAAQDAATTHLPLTTEGLMNALVMQNKMLIESQTALQNQINLDKEQRLLTQPIPVFSGSRNENINLWLFQIDSIFALYPTGNTIRLWAITNGLKGAALLWYQNQCAPYLRTDQ